MTTVHIAIRIGAFFTTTLKNLRNYHFLAIYTLYTVVYKCIFHYVYRLYEGAGSLEQTSRAEVHCQTLLANLGHMPTAPIAIGMCVDALLRATSDVTLAGARVGVTSHPSRS